MRAYRPGLVGRWGVSANVELGRAVVRRSSGVVREVGLVGFWDAAAVDTVAVISFSGRAMKPLYDAGVGLRARFHVGDLTFPLRVEFPFYLSDPFYAHNNRQGSDLVEFRWLVSLQPIF